MRETLTNKIRMITTMVRLNNMRIKITKITNNLIKVVKTIKIMISPRITPKETEMVIKMGIGMVITTIIMMMMMMTKTRRTTENNLIKRKTKILNLTTKNRVKNKRG